MNHKKAHENQNVLEHIPIPFSNVTKSRVLRLRVALKEIIKNLVSLSSEQ